MKADHRIVDYSFLQWAVILNRRQVRLPGNGCACPLISLAGEIRMYGQTLFTAMLVTVIVLVLLTLLVATDPDPGEIHPIH